MLQFQTSDLPFDPRPSLTHRFLSLHGNTPSSFAVIFLPRPGQRLSWHGGGHGRFELLVVKVERLHDVTREKQFGDPIHQYPRFTL